MAAPPTKDFELLSAYLDGELAPSVKAGLEARLAVDAELRAALDELRQTVAVLRTAPILQPPRNFTLDPAKYRRPIPWWRRLNMPRSLLALGTAAAALALVFVFVFVLMSPAGSPISSDIGRSFPATPTAAAAQFRPTPVAGEVRVSTQIAQTAIALQVPTEPPPTLAATRQMALATQVVQTAVAIQATPMPTLSIRPSNTSTPVATQTITLAPTQTQAPALAFEVSSPTATRRDANQGSAEGLTMPKTLERTQIGKAGSDMLVPATMAASMAASVPISPLPSATLKLSAAEPPSLVFTATPTPPFFPGPVPTATLVAMSTTMEHDERTAPAPGTQGGERGAINSTATSTITGTPTSVALTITETGTPTPTAVSSGYFEGTQQALSDVDRLLPILIIAALVALLISLIIVVAILSSRVRP